MADTDPRPNTPAGVSRRDILKMGGALAGAGAAVTALGTPLTALANSARSELNEATVVQLQGMMASGRLSSAELVDYYLERIASLDQSGPRVNAVLELNPDARAIARALDRERHHSGARGPLHGIPVLLKDNIDTHDRMQTAAGSLALVGTPALQDSTVAARLRRAGAVILGKTNLSEWANFRSTFSSSGWSGRGGQCNNPYILDRNPCGSSSGSGAAASANFTAVSIGTETDGSIVCPAHMNGVVGIKPTVGLTSRAGVVPISHTQDTVGPHARTVADAAALLGALVGVDPRDPATAASAGKFFSDYTQFLDPNALRTARLGVLRDFVGVGSPHSDTVFEKALTALASAGATLVDITGFPGLAQINSGAAETTVLFNEFKHDLNAYLATRTGVPIHSLAEGIAFNIAHAAQEMPYFAQEIWDLAEATSGDLGNPDYLAALATDRQLGVQGIDAVLAANNLDALVGPTASPAWPTDLVNGDRFIFGTSSIAAIVGYPIVVVPMGFAFGLPLGISFFGTAFSEPTLIKLAYAFEQATHFRQQPQFLPTLNAGAGEPPDERPRRGQPNLQQTGDRPRHL